jgi:glycosyltransferase involved in cell wall biosynthesis
MEATELCDKYQLCPDAPVILYVDRIDPDKKVDRVIRVAAKVMGDLNVQLFIVGDGKPKDELIKLCQELGIDQNCCFPGFISKHEDLPGIYRFANVFVTASEAEIQNSVVHEAAASGLPVATTEASSMTELVIVGKTDFITRPGDIDKMAERLILLVKDPDKATTMGKNGRKLVEAHSNERFLFEHEKLYQSILKMPDRALRQAR